MRQKFHTFFGFSDNLTLITICKEKGGHQHDDNVEASYFWDDLSILSECEKMPAFTWNAIHCIAVPEIVEYLFLT